MYKIPQLFLLALTFFAFQACSEGGKENTTKTETQDEPMVEEVNTLGAYAGLVGAWTVDAATAGVQLDLTFGQDGSFSQKMGDIQAEGTWEVVDAEHIIITTDKAPNGQKWRVTNLSGNGVDLCWNPDAANPKTIPMQKVHTAK